MQTQSLRGTSPTIKPWLLAYLATFLVVVVIGIFVYASQTNVTSTPEQRISSLSNGFVNFLLFNLATGLTAMALLETIKILFFIRGFFHEYVILKLTKTKRSQLKEELSPGLPDHSLLATRLDIPIVQLTAQLASKIDAALGTLGTLGISESSDYDLGSPTYEHSSSSTDTVAPASIPATEIPVVLKAFLDVKSIKTFEKITKYQYHPKEVQNIIADLREETESNLDAFQSSLSSSWRWLMRFAASLISMVIAVFALLIFSFTILETFILLFGSFVFGGYFAGFAHDLVSIVRPRRRR